VGTEGTGRCRVGGGRDGREEGEGGGEGEGKRKDREVGGLLSRQK